MQIKRIRICIQHIYIIANCDDTGGIVRSPPPQHELRNAGCSNQRSDCHNRDMIHHSDLWDNWNPTQEFVRHRFCRYIPIRRIPVRIRQLRASRTALQRSAETGIRHMEYFWRCLASGKISDNPAHRIPVSCLCPEYTDSN